MGFPDGGGVNVDPDVIFRVVEASPVDPIWGIGLAATDPRAQDPSQWAGLNLLGFALMRVRDQLTRAAG